ncbi:hypothetical protein ASG97_14730 [Bacillus sp. Soil745]|nr:hypothetical protein ASG97_14730 [Bacillus sp. Soil745]
MRRLSKHDSIQRDQLEMITLDQLVPPNHLVRKMEAATKHDSIQRDQLEMITLDQLVPPNHLVRKMEAAINLKKMANWAWRGPKMA